MQFLILSMKLKGTLTDVSGFVDGSQLVDLYLCPGLTGRRDTLVLQTRCRSAASGLGMDRFGSGDACYTAGILQPLLQTAWRYQQKKLC